MYAGDRREVPVFPLSTPKPGPLRTCPLVPSHPSPRAYKLPVEQEVSIVDVTIIYLACGAPFGVYRASSGDSTWMRVVLSVLIWPVFAIRLATSKGRQRATNIQDLLLSTRKSIETAAFVASSPEAVFDFREIFDRYTGLALAAQESAAPAVAGLFELTGHPSRPLAESCMVRSQKA